MPKPAVSKAKRSFLPSWAANLIGFVLLTGFVIAIFFQQQVSINQNLQKNSSNRSHMVAGIIEKNINNATASQETIDTLASSFLRDNARFIAYLDTIDPMQPIELEALAKETGLLGITIHRTPMRSVEGPVNWDLHQYECSSPINTVYYDLESKQALLNYTETAGDFPCITLGIDASAIVDLRNKTGLTVLFQNLSALPGIHYVHMEKPTALPPINSKVTLIKTKDTHTAETRIQTPNGTLIVGLDAGNFIQRRHQLRKQFVLFSSLLFVLTLLFSWILYRKQQAELQRTREFERMLAKEHESAALGRATATIAHEVRNPLNAINMGLQRLKLESDNLEQEQLELISAMGEAVRRTSTIVGGLQRFTKNLSPDFAHVNLENLINILLTLYAAQCEEAGIAVEFCQKKETLVEADCDLINELLENLIKNSIEAQPNGGFITLDLSQKNNQILLQLTNGGFILDREQAGRLGEPYYTTKTRGSGLGLAFCKRITEAHNGILEILPDYNKQQVTICIALPIRQNLP